MNIIEKLISGYPSGDVAPQDFIDHLSIGADGWVGAWAVMAATTPVIILPWRTWIRTGIAGTEN